VRQLGPGSELPQWIVELETEAFGGAWGPLEEGECLWSLEDLAFARWRLIDVVGEAELLRIAVAPSARRRGLGQRLLQANQSSLAALGCDTLHLEVRVSNLPARALYESLGWREVGLRKGYYRDGEDAALYRRDLP